MSGSALAASKPFLCPLSSALRRTQKATCGNVGLRQCCPVCRSRPQAGCTSVNSEPTTARGVVLRIRSAWTAPCQSSESEHVLKNQVFLDIFSYLFFFFFWTSFHSYRFRFSNTFRALCKTLLVCCLVWRCEAQGLDGYRWKSPARMSTNLQGHDSTSDGRLSAPL